MSDRVSTSSGKALKILYLHPISRRDIRKGWLLGTHPDTLLMGLNHMYKHGIEATLVDPDQNVAYRFLSPIEKFAHSRLSQQLQAFSLKNHDVIVCRDFSTVSLLSLLKRTGVEKRPIVLTGVIVHSSLRFKKFISKLLKNVNTIVYQARIYRRILVENGVIEPRLVFSPWSVDHRFFKPLNGDEEEDYILSVGNSGRDFYTLVKAVKDLRLKLTIATDVGVYSKLSRANIHVCKMNPVQLRDAYAKCRFAVVPTFDLEWVPGCTSVLEAMAMGKAVIASRTDGLSEFIEHGKNGLMVTPCNPRELREAITYLYEDPEETRKLGINGRVVVEQRFNTEMQALVISDVVKKTASDTAAEPAP